MKKTRVMSCSLFVRMRVSECTYPVNVTRDLLIYVSGKTHILRGELIYLAPLGSENMSAPYFKQCFFQVGLLPPD